MSVQLKNIMDVHTVKAMMYPRPCNAACVVNMWQAIMSNWEMAQSLVKIAMCDIDAGGMRMKSIQKVSQEEKELKVLIASLKNVFTDVPYDFMYENVNDNVDDDDNNEDDEYYD